MTNQAPDFTQSFIETNQSTTTPQPILNSPPSSDFSSSFSGANQNTQPSNKNTKLPLILAIVIFFIATSGVVAHRMGFLPLDQFKNTSSPAQPATTAESPDNKQTDTEPISSTELPEESLFSGKVIKLDEDLKLFKVPEDIQIDYENNPPSYYSAGVYKSSALEGYTRIIAIRESEGPGPALSFILATKDFQSYILHDPENLTTNYAEDDWQNPFQVLDKSKITQTQSLPSHHPQLIELDEIFALHLNSSITETIKNGFNSQGYSNYIPQLVTSLSKHQPLNYHDQTLKLLFRQHDVPELNWSETPESALLQQQIETEFYLADSSVVVVDSTGLLMHYSLATKPAINSYNKKQATYLQKVKEYKQLIKKYDSGKISEYPSFPNYVEKPSLGFSGDQVRTNTNLSFFNSYHIAFPGACGMEPDTKVVKLNDTELERIGAANNLPLYRLIDPNHILNKFAYSNKLDYYLNSQEDDHGYDIFSQMHDGADIPTYQEYLEKNPLLFIKDYWDRWVVVGEYDILLPGGCGKPVIYLYPTQETEVEVRLLKPIQFSTDLPKYHQQWRVLAQTNGMLTDLQPNLTDCATIDDNKPGLEYAKQACINNTYPYLYWSGNVIGSAYPQVTQGWVVSRPELESFLIDKLNEMGLSYAERTDFLDYWLPQMLSNDANFFQVGFLQTNELNQFIPMAVKPTPDTIFRIFLDYKLLNSKPEQLPEPQKLQKLERKGFTLVEWGGLKK